MLELNLERVKKYHSTYTPPMAKTYTTGHSEESLLVSFICATSIMLKLRFLNTQEIYLLLTSQIWNIYSYLFSLYLTILGHPGALLNFGKSRKEVYYCDDSQTSTWWLNFYLKLKW